jgi:trans-2,3-dihydro-3-hydroxyanthranilate isomerase
MRHRYVTCDVFTTTRFGGNQLAVLPDARGLTAEQMQQVAREFNYSESTFVLPAERGHDHRVRIFTPAREVPFAGHPNVGTAFVLASIGALGDMTGPRTVHFEEAAGIVPVSIEPRGDGRFWCELEAPRPLTLGPELPFPDVAHAVGLSSFDLRTDAHVPRWASVGLPFIIAELVDLVALGRARPDSAALARLVPPGRRTMPDIHLYVRMPAGDPIGLDIRARMFAPLDGVPEDPATGSANGALAGLLASLADPRDGELRWRIGQGVEMGRPSLLEARARRVDGEVAGVWIGGESVLVSEGTIEV